MRTDPFGRRPTAAVDFDGVIIPDSKDTRTDVQLWRVTRQLPEPLPGAREGLAWLRKQGYEVIIHTARPHADREFIEAILRKAGAHLLVDLLMFYTKPNAALYLDDKAIRFTGWAELPGQLAAVVAGVPFSQEPNTLFEEWLKQRRWLELGRLLPPELPARGVTVLDIGCGRAPHYPDWVRAVSIVEPDGESARVARQNERRITAWLPALVTNVDDAVTERFNPAAFNPAAFDLVTIMGVLEHVADPAQFLRQFDAAKRLFVTVPNAASFHRRVGQRMGIIQTLDELGPADHAIGHQRQFLPKQFEELMLRHAGSISGVLNFQSIGFKVADNATMAHLLPCADALADELDDLVNSLPQRSEFKWYLGAELAAYVERGTR